jgi:transcriptional activator SPT7
VFKQILSAPITEASPTPDTPIPSSTCHPPLIIDEDAAQQMMQRTIIQLLTHAGFEGSHTMPLGIITELVAERFSNIGKTIRNYWDEYNHIMTGEEILLHTLHENGVNQLDDLEVYITDDVERHGDRLNGVVRKLEGAYRDIINVSNNNMVKYSITNPIDLRKASTEDTVQDESNLFEDQESFIT